jgi:ribulose 1,5-bisphosphate carboxylase large subunit-like protein
MCQLKKLELPESWKVLYPNFGITGMRDKTRNYGKPFLGGIIKPKTGLNPTELLEMTKALVYGGVDFIKEDEILGNPAVCPFYDRVDLITEWFYKYNIKNVMYTFCINGDPRAVKERYDYVRSYGFTNNITMGIHLNVWSGLGQYKELRETGPLFLHYQKSGDKVFTCENHKFHIDWKVLCYLAGICGVDSIHAGMLGGYLDDDEEDMLEVVDILQKRNVIPALSCGMTPDHVGPITDKIGVDWMANVGGFIHSDPGGTEAGTLKMREAIDKL